MKTRTIIKTMAIVTFSLLLSSSIFAQEKPAKKDACCTTTAKHKCTDECKTLGCDAVKAKGAKAKHKCTSECKTIGCAAVDAKVAKTKAPKHVCTAECKEKGCDFVKAKEARAALDLNHDGSIYECPMKCEAGSDKPGNCSKCGMELKKVSVKS